MKKKRTRNKSYFSIQKLFTLPKRRILPYGIVAAVIAVVGMAGVVIYIHKANSRQQVASTPAAYAKPEETAVAQATQLTPAETAPVPSTATPQTSEAGLGRTSASKLNKDGQMPTVTTKRLIVSPSVVTYDRMTNPSTAFTVTTEDGRAVRPPSGYLSGCCFVAGTEFSRTDKSSWNMFLDMGAYHDRMMDPNTPQSYVVPLQIITGDGRGNEIRYNGSVTVVVAL